MGLCRSVGCVSLEESVVAYQILLMLPKGPQVENPRLFVWVVGKLMQTTSEE